jgi:predicted Zn-dependent protease
MKRANIYFQTALMLMIVSLVISCAVNPVTGKRQIMLMSEAQEIQLGVSYNPQVLATFGEYDNANMQAFVQAKGEELAKICHRPTLEYHIKVVDSPVVNAFAIPGGYIYLTRGIMAQLNNEAELAGVMGHEMGHITARHSVSQQTKQTLGQLVLIGAMIASEKFAQYAETAMQGMQLLFLSFSRTDEREADRLGVEYSSKIGYDAHKMADFFQVLQKMNMASSEGGVPTFLSTHPDPGDRYNAVNEKATEWQTKLNLPEYKVNQDSYLRLIDGIVYGEDPKQGYVEGNIFYHPELKFRFAFPSGWKLENTPLQVTISPTDGKALMIFTISPQKTLQAAADTTLAQIGLTLKNSNTTTVNGMQAIVTLSQQVTQDQSTGAQSTNDVLSYFINYDNVIYVFHGVTTEADFNTYTNSFESTMKSFAKLTDASKINVKPTLLHIKAVQRAGTLADAFTYYGVPDAKRAELALLNNMELTDKVTVGKMIKIVGQ